MNRLKSLKKIRKSSQNASNQINIKILETGILNNKGIMLYYTEDSTPYMSHSYNFSYKSQC